MESDGLKCGGALSEDLLCVPSASSAGERLFSYRRERRGSRREKGVGLHRIELRRMRLRMAPTCRQSGGITVQNLCGRLLLRQLNLPPGVSEPGDRVRRCNRAPPYAETGPDGPDGPQWLRSSPNRHNRCRRTTRTCLKRDNFSYGP